MGRPTIDGVTGPEPTAHWLGGVERWNRTHRWASDVLLALALLAVLGALSVAGARGLHWQRGWLIVLVAAFLLLHVTVAFRQHAPELACVVASAALLVITRSLTTGSSSRRGRNRLKYGRRETCVFVAWSWWARASGPR